MCNLLDFNVIFVFFCIVLMVDILGEFKGRFFIFGVGEEVVDISVGFWFIIVSFDGNYLVVGDSSGNFCIFDFNSLFFYSF